MPRDPSRAPAAPPSADAVRAAMRDAVECVQREGHVYERRPELVGELIHITRQAQRAGLPTVAEHVATARRFLVGDDDPPACLAALRTALAGCP
jgi:hypothetical protein